MKMNWKQNSTKELVPEATYRVEIKRREACAAATGTPQVRWYAEILDGPYASKTLVDHTALTENALWRLGKFVSACGVKTGVLPDMEVGSPLFEKTLDTCIGQTDNWRVEVSTFNGKTNNKVLDYIREDSQPECMVELALDEAPSFLSESEDGKPI